MADPLGGTSTACSRRHCQTCLFLLRRETKGGRGPHEQGLIRRRGTGMALRLVGAFFLFYPFFYCPLTFVISDTFLILHSPVSRDQAGESSVTDGMAPRLG